jgi:hypothetical protein
MLNTEKNVSTRVAQGQFLNDCLLIVFSAYETKIQYLSAKNEHLQVSSFRHTNSIHEFRCK